MHALLLCNNLQVSLAAALVVPVAELRLESQWQRLCKDGLQGVRATSPAPCVLALPSRTSPLLSCGCGCRYGYHLCHQPGCRSQLLHPIEGRQYPGISKGWGFCCLCMRIHRAVCLTLRMCRPLLGHGHLRTSHHVVQRPSSVLLHLQNSS